MKKTLGISLPILLVCLIFLSSPVFALNQVFNVRHWTAPDNTRIVIDAVCEPVFDVQEKDDTLIIDIYESEIVSDLALQYDLDVPAVSTVRVIPLPGETTRVEVSLSEGVVTKVFKLGEILDKPHRIVIDIKIPEIEHREADERQKIGVRERKKIIVLDPGHGGEDPGAIGRRGTREKDVVLEIARELQKLLIERGYQVFLTRDGDYYVSLMKRGEIARQYDADLFISIHADAAPVRSVQGSSVYCLSSIAASNEAARLLAASQNISDILGGDPGNGNSDDADRVILNMLQTETLNQSRTFGSITLRKVSHVNDLKFKSVQGAPFRVLKLPDITSVLVETAYLSNPREELFLRNPAFRSDIAWALAAAVTEYFPNRYAEQFKEMDARYEPRSRAMKLVRGEKTYKVRRGDRLEKIAANHGTTVREIMALNDIRSRDRIYVGQTLTIPGDYGLIEPSPVTPIVYTVEAGDTLERVARRYGVSMADLVRVNSIQVRDRIYVGQTLYLSEPPSQAEAAATPTVHVVKKGDTLERIAGRYGVPMAELERMNNLRSRDRIYVGQRLVVARSPVVEAVRPSTPTTHVVSRGETLEQIARRYGVTVRDLIYANKLKSADRILVGQRLDIPIAGNGRKKTVYTVSRGDTLETIARRFGTTVESLMDENSLRSRHVIYAGQQLTISPP